MYVLALALRRLILTSFVVHLTTRISLIAMDFLVLVLTWVKTFSQWRESRRVGISRSITESLLRDGKSA